MHPIERLRYVARATGVEQSLLVRETATALASFRTDPQGLVTACRRTVERHPSAGALWTLCTRVLLADDAMVEAWHYADQVEEDPTGRELGVAFGDDWRAVVLGWPDIASDGFRRRGDVEALVIDVHGEGGGFVQRLLAGSGLAADIPITGMGSAVSHADVVVLEASAVGPESFLAVAGSLPAAAVARHLGVPVWLVVGEGRMVARDTWNALEGLLPERTEPWYADDEVLSLALVDHVVGPRGIQTVPAALQAADLAVAPELFGSHG